MQHWINCDNCDKRECLSVCLSVSLCSHIPETILSNFIKFTVHSMCVDEGVDFCVCLCPRLEKKTLELSTQTWYTCSPCQDLSLTSACMTVRSKVKGQGHAVIRCTAGVGLQVDMTVRLNVRRYHVSPAVDTV